MYSSNVLCSPCKPRTLLCISSTTLHLTSITRNKAKVLTNRWINILVPKDSRGRRGFPEGLLIGVWHKCVFHDFYTKYNKWDYTRRAKLCQNTKVLRMEGSVGSDHIR